jgi:hypothetical protein
MNQSNPTQNTKDPVMTAINNTINRQAGQHKRAMAKSFADLRESEGTRSARTLLGYSSFAKERDEQATAAAQKAADEAAQRIERNAKSERRAVLLVLLAFTVAIVAIVGTVALAMLPHGF